MITKPIKTKSKIQSVKIAHFSRLSFFMLLLVILGSTIDALFLIFGVAYKSIDIIVIGALIAVPIIIFLLCIFNYGVKITSKRVVISFLRELKIFSYDDVYYIKIALSPDYLSVKVKARGQEVYEFCFTNSSISPASIIPFVIKVKLSQKFIRKCVNTLSGIEKVEVEVFAK